MGIIKKFLVLVYIINTFCFSYVYMVQESEEIQALKKQASDLQKEIEAANAELDKFIQSSNRASTVAAFGAGQSEIAINQAREALRIATEAEKSTEKIQQLQDKFVQVEKDAELNLQESFNQIKKDLKDLMHKQSEQGIDESIKIKIAKIEEMVKRGIYKQKAKIAAEAKIEIESVRWDKIKKIITSPELILTTSAIATLTYLAKHGIPFLINRLSQPSVILETSNKFWGSNKNQPDISITDLIFSPVLQKQLFDLALRIKSAKTYNENLPNMLFYGAPGTGKSAFVRALAKDSGLNYAFTSGTEFAKIKDLNIANDELRKLLNWAKNETNGLIIFIDEAESLFSNRNLPETSKTAQDFINTFLALVPEKSNKKLMFIFATNHPFKLDDAIIDRIGPKIEFVLPEVRERNMILSFYLQRFADENKNAKVDIHSEVKEKLALYSESLDGFSPRAIKFVAEEMIINARRQECKLLTHEVAQLVLNEATKNLNQEDLWKSERAEWVAARRA